MKDCIKKKVSDIAEGRLTGDQIEELIGFFKQVLSDNLGREDERFFRNIAYEMTGDIKELAFLIVNFRKELKSRICPEITELAERHIPQAADQLEGVIETTETAANRIMDNLEIMQSNAEKMQAVVEALEKRQAGPSGNPRTVAFLSSIPGSLQPLVETYLSLISDTFVQMSFQDLTGQRIKRIMALVGQMEDRLKKMIFSFGFRLSEHEKKTSFKLAGFNAASNEQFPELAGPQRSGDGLGQSDIDELLLRL